MTRPTSGPTALVGSSRKSSTKPGTPALQSLLREFPVHCSKRRHLYATADIRCHPGLPDRHVLQHLQDVFLDGLDVGFDLLERPGWNVAVEVAVEVDLVADVTDQAVLAVAPGGVDPGIGHMGLDLALEEGADTGRHPLAVSRILPFGKRDALGVAKLRVRLGHAVLVAADLGRLVALGRGQRGLR